MPNKHVYTYSIPEEERIVSLTQAAQIIGVAPGTIKNNYPKYVLVLSKRRRGVKLKHVQEIIRDRAG